MIRLLTFTIALLQIVLSVKPGFVDVVDGESNVHRYDHVSMGKPVETGTRGRVEMGLGLESRLRLDENSAATLEAFDRENVSVRIEKGSALLEVANLDKPNRIHVSFNNIHAQIDSKGVFRFSGNSVSAIEGRFKVVGGSVTVQKGSQITSAGGEYRQSKLALATPPAFKSFLNSPKAGFVNAIEGEANIRAYDVAREEQPIKTGPASYVELLLCPGAFMRVDENSEVMFDSNALNDIVIQVSSGSVLIENVVSDPRFHIRVNVGGSKLVIDSAGLYRFTSDTASVISGALQIGPNGASAISGTQVRMANKQYETEELPSDLEPTGLDRWSVDRSYQLARANFMADYSDSSANFFLYVSPVPYFAAWMYSPSLNALTFVTTSVKKSYYGNSFVPLYVLMPTGTSSIPLSLRVPAPAPPRPPSTTRAPTSNPPTVPPAQSTPAPTPAPKPESPTPNK
jgi:FecR protein